MVEKNIVDSTANAILEKMGIFTASVYGSDGSGYVNKDGSTSTESTTVGDTSMEDTYDVTDRSVHIKITRDDDGCEWAYDNDVAVSNNVDRLDSILNNGFVVRINPDYIKGDKRPPKAEKARRLIKKRIVSEKLQEKLSVMIKNRAIYGFGITKKLMSGKDVVGLVEIDSKECTPIRNLSTGELGGDVGKGLNPDNKEMEVAMIQYGNTVVYDYQGNATYTNTYFYFTDDEIIYITNNDRGKFKGVSPVMRTLRLVEIKKTLENAVELLTKRFGPQMWVIVGNEINNLSTTDIPQEYLVDSDGNQIDKATARKNFKTAVFSAIDAQIKRWVNGDALVQLAEFGVDIKTINPSSSTFDYQKYIELCADFIKIGILGLDMPGRVDVTSGIMQTRLTRDLRDKFNRDRGIIEGILNERFTKPILMANGYESDLVEIRFKNLDLNDELQDVELELKKSQTIYNYMKGGWTDLPEHLKEKWGIDPKGKVISIDDMKENLRNEKKKTEKKEEEDDDENSRGKKRVINPTIRRRIDDVNRGR